MKNLLELTKIIFKILQQDPQKILPKNKNSKIYLLLNSILEGKIKEEQEAATLIYKASAQEKKYLMLKNNLKNKLYDFLLTQEELDNYSSSYFRTKKWCQKNLIIADTLIQTQFYLNAEHILQKVRLNANKYFLINEEMQAAMQLRTIYTLKGDFKNVEKYTYLINESLENLRYQIEAQSLWEILYTKTTLIIAKSEELASRGEVALKRLNECRKQYDSPVILSYYYDIKIIQAYNAYDAEGLLAALNQKKALLAEHKFLTSKNTQAYLSFGFAQYFKDIKEYDKALQQVEVGLTHAKNYSRYWFKLNLLALRCHLHALDYRKAGEVMQEVYQNEYFKDLSAAEKKVWLLHEAYLYYILLTQKELAYVKDYTPNFVNQFSISSFLDNLKPLLKDKKGYNINIIFLKVLFTNEKDIDLDNSFHLANNLSIYYHRYIKNLKEPRTKIFFKILTRTVKENFDKEATLKSIRHYRKLLNTTNTAFEEVCEFIPYDFLWNLLESRLR